MRKIIHEYEERNKVIEAIEKNLRMGHHKNRGSPQKIKDQTSITNYNTLDLPYIPHKNVYSPKKQIDSPLKHKQSIKSIEETEIPKKHSPWIQTITFRPDQEDERESPKIILNNRFTMRNFMRTTQSLLAKKQSSQTIDNSIFLTPRKINQQSKKELPKLQQKIASIQNKIKNHNRKSQSLELTKKANKNEEKAAHKKKIQKNKKDTKISLDSLVEVDDFQKKMKEEDKKIQNLQARRRIKYSPRQTKSKLLRNNSSHLYSPWDADIVQGNTQIWQKYG